MNPVDKIPKQKTEDVIDYIRVSQEVEESKKVVKTDIISGITAAKTQSFYQNLFFRYLKHIQVGRLVVIFRGKEYFFGGRSEDGRVQMTIKSDAFFKKAVLGGDLGIAESYMEDEWICSDLTALIQLMIRNRPVLNKLSSVFSFCNRFIQKIYHFKNRNSLDGSKRNIAAHYDLSNAFFRCFLDPTLSYSAAVFDSPTLSLEEASIAKIKRLCDKLRLEKSDHLLEIGTGWGMFAIFAAKIYGCQVTTTTISQKQYELAIQRVAEHGLTRQVNVIQEDYRDLKGKFDKIVSVEMIEAVGHDHYDTFFKKCSDLLKPEGLIAIQAITIDDRRYEQARKHTDFIKRYIFPGSCIPSFARLNQAIIKKTSLQLFHFEDITDCYAETLKIWRENFYQHLEHIRALGFDDYFIRMWEYYFCYCEGGFRERAISDIQFILTNPQTNLKPILGKL